MLQLLIIQFTLYYLSSGCKVKNKESFKFLAVKLVLIAYERWLLTRDSNYSNLTEKVLVFRTTGC